MGKNDCPHMLSTAFHLLKRLWGGPCSVDRRQRPQVCSSVVMG
jgi:hypothetical protein